MGLLKAIMGGWKMEKMCIRDRSRGRNAPSLFAAALPAVRLPGPSFLRAPPRHIRQSQQGLLELSGKFDIAPSSDLEQQPVELVHGLVALGEQQFKHCLLYTSVLRPSAQTFFAGGRGARKRRAHAPAPPVRPSVPLVIAASGHAKRLAFAAFRPSSCDYGRNGKGSGDCCGP